MVILTCSVLQDNTGVYQMQDCVRDHEEKTLGEVMGKYGACTGRPKKGKQRTSTKIMKSL